MAQSTAVFRDGGHGNASLACCFKDSRLSSSRTGHEPQPPGSVTVAILLVLQLHKRYLGPLVPIFCCCCCFFGGTGDQAQVHSTTELHPQTGSR